MALDNSPVQSFVTCKINYSKYISLIGYEARALGFLDLEPGPSPQKARAKPCLGPGLRGPGRAGLKALSPAQHITILYVQLRSAVPDQGHPALVCKDRPVWQSSLRAWH